MTKCMIDRLLRCALVVLCAVVVLVVVGCGGGKPRLSGLGLGDRRLVTVGETIELRMPLAEDGGRRWRVSSYDSFFITVAGTPRVETLANGDREMVVVARARNSGETRIEVSEVSPPDGTAEVVRFDVRILP